MTNSKDGGPAFPTGLRTGMTLRDYFAAKAMQGYLAADPTFECDLHEVADMAYEQADAMLKARQA